MNTAPLLPETSFKPLTEARLDAMINNAVAARQLPKQAPGNVIAFRRPWAFGTGMAAMAASIMLAFMFTPQYSTVTTASAATAEDTTVTADVGDLLLLDSLGA